VLVRQGRLVNHVGMGELLDPLTGLPGYDAASGKSPRWPALIAQEGDLALLSRDAALVAIDLREFKRVNDERGHDFGNRFLAEVARRLCAAADPWPVFRIGGDEFLVATRLPSEDAVLAFALALRVAVEAPFDGARVDAWVAAARAFEGEEPQQLIEAVDTALLAVRQNGWPEVLVAPPGADHTTWFERPDPRR
jgi:diguanylate cyclase (GGDEF)-like protein